MIRKLALALLALCCQWAQAAEEVLVFGDSLSKEYSVEFPDVNAMNWIEILDKERHEDFDNGSFRAYPDFRATGRKYNWSFPGATTDDMLDNLTGGGFFQEIAQDEIKDHLRSEVSRVVIFLGGNDLEKRYSRLYNNNDPEPVMNLIYNNLQEIVSFVKRRNSQLQIVLVNAPHIGATPKIKDEHGTDPAKVAFVSDLIEGLNVRLAQLARDEGIGYADVYQITKDMVDGRPFCISGVRFLDESNDNAGKFYLWLGGPLGGDFHPNTNGQARVANAIIEAFNRRYDAGIVPLGDTEILQSLLSIDPDRSFEDWIACYEPGELGRPQDDLDNDGRDNLNEFVFDTDPTRPDTARVTCPSPYEIDYRLRLRSSANFTARVETSTDLKTWVPASANELSEQPFGKMRWTASDVNAPQIFARFVVTVP